MGKSKYQAAEVNDPSGRRLMKSRTTTTPPAHVAWDVYIVPAGATGEWATHIGEIAGSDGSAWIYEASPPDGLRAWIEDENVSVVCSGGQFRDEVASHFEYDADLLMVPNNADWAVNANAGGDQDSNNASSPVKKFDSATEEGVGLREPSAPGTSKLRLALKIRAETAPAAARTAGLKIYARELGGAIWNSVVLNDASIPVDETWQTFVQTVTLASLSVGDGKLIQFEITRIAPGAGINLEGDLTLTHVKGDFL